MRLATYGNLPDGDVYYGCFECLSALQRAFLLTHAQEERPMEKIQVVLVKARETKGTYVYEEEFGAGGKPPVLKTQYIQKWVLGSNPPNKIKVTIEPA